MIITCLGLRSTGSGNEDDDLAVLELHGVDPQRCGAGGRTSGVELKGVQMERAQYDFVVDLPVRNWAPLVRANCRHCTKAAIPLAEHRNLMISSHKGSTFAVRDLVDGAA
jgi:hypothetical protein